MPEYWLCGRGMVVMANSNLFQKGKNIIGIFMYTNYYVFMYVHMYNNIVVRVRFVKGFHFEYLFYKIVGDSILFIFLICLQSSH